MADSSASPRPFTPASDHHHDDSWRWMEVEAELRLEAKARKKFLERRCVGRGARDDDRRNAVKVVRARCPKTGKVVAETPEPMLRRMRRLRRREREAAMALLGAK